MLALFFKKSTKASSIEEAFFVCSSKIRWLILLKLISLKLHFKLIEQFRFTIDIEFSVDVFNVTTYRIDG